MKVEVEVISEDVVKPSSPTPHHLRHYTLSFLDQITVDVYNPLLYFYSPENQANFNLHDISDKLKISLSGLLTHYYPLAGRADYDEQSIDCNDEGVPFFQARVAGNMSDFIRQSNPIDLNKLLPFELDELNEYPMAVQLNVFECGGVGVGILISHKIGDALSFLTVMNAWAAMAAGEATDTRVHLKSAELFPKQSLPVENTRQGIERNRVAKRFLFDAAKIDTLRAKYTGSSVLKDERPPSRVESLSAFLYGRFLAAARDEAPPSNRRFYLVIHAVNVRPRVDPPLPEYAFGNYYRVTTVTPSPETLKGESSHGLVKDVREHVSKIDKEFLRTFQENERQVGFLKLMETFSDGRIEWVTFAFTSLIRFPLYEADFGWGKPVWVGSPALTFKNLIAFFPDKEGSGIEAYIHLRKEHMAKLEADEEFLKYASPTGAEAGVC